MMQIGSNNHRGDFLQPLQEDGVRELLTVLATDLPSSAIIYNWIKTQTEWAKRKPEIKVSVMCPDGDWSDGTVVGIVEGLGKVLGACYTLQKDGAKLKKALVESKLIPWDTLSYFTGVIDRHVPICEEALRQVPGLIDSVNVRCQMHFLSAQDAAKLKTPEIPSNVRLGQLDASHLETLCKHWPHYSPDHRPIVEQMIALNPSCGVFVQNKDGAEDLAAMILQSEYGGLGLLQTLPEFKGNGYTLMALAQQTRTLGQAGVHVHCNVMLNEGGSDDKVHPLALYEKIGLDRVAISQLGLRPKTKMTL